MPEQTMTREETHDALLNAYLKVNGATVALQRLFEHADPELASTAMAIWRELTKLQSRLYDQQLRFEAGTPEPQP